MPRAWKSCTISSCNPARRAAAPFLTGRPARRRALKTATACPVRFVAPTLNPTNQSSGARCPWRDCRPPAVAEEGSMKPMAGHPPAKEVGFGLAQTAGWALLFCAKPRTAENRATGPRPDERRTPSPGTRGRGFCCVRFSGCGPGPGAGGRARTGRARRPFCGATAAPAAVRRQKAWWWR